MFRFTTFRYPKQTFFGCLGNLDGERHVGVRNFHAKRKGTAAGQPKGAPATTQPSEPLGREDLRRNPMVETLEGDQGAFFFLCLALCVCLCVCLPLCLSFNVCVCANLCSKEAHISLFPTAGGCGMIVGLHSTKVPQSWCTESDQLDVPFFKKVALLQSCYVPFLQAV